MRKARGGPFLALRDVKQKLPTFPQLTNSILTITKSKTGLDRSELAKVTHALISYENLSKCTKANSFSNTNGTVMLQPALSRTVRVDWNLGVAGKSPVCDPERLQLQVVGKDICYTFPSHVS